MGKGLPKWAIKEATKRGAKNVFAYAWTLVKRKGKKRKTKSRRSSNPTKRRVKRTVKKRRRRSFFSASTIFKWLRVAALVAPAAGHALNPSLNGRDKVYRAIADYTGFQLWNGKFNWGRLANGWMPYIVTCLVTNGIQKLNGIIRRL